MKKENPFSLMTGTHRLSYVHVAAPAHFEGESTPKYDVTLLIEKDHPDVDRIRNVIKAVYLANKESIFKGAKLISPSLKYPLRDGDEKFAEKPDAKEYEGCYYLRATAKNQPSLLHRVAGKVKLLTDPEDIYSGCYARAKITGFAYNFQGMSKGISFFLDGLLKVKGGERFGRIEVTPEDFEDDYDYGDDREDDYDDADGLI
jgi:hypothetical protein